MARADTTGYLKHFDKICVCSRRKFSNFPLVWKYVFPRTVCLSSLLSLLIADAILKYRSNASLSRAFTRKPLNCRADRNNWYYIHIRLTRLFTFPRSWTGVHRIPRSHRADAGGSSVGDSFLFYAANVGTGQPGKYRFQPIAYDCGLWSFVRYEVLFPAAIFCCSTLVVIGFSALVDLWVIKMKKPMILCARSTSRSRELRCPNDYEYRKMPLISPPFPRL